MKRQYLNFFLQAAPAQELETLCKQIHQEHSVETLQKPTSQTLLLPVSDPINQGSFISGELLVTSAIVKINSENGWAMVMDDQPEKALRIATLDGAFAAGKYVDQILLLALKGKANLELEDEQTNRKVNSTRVAFDLL